MPMPGWNILRGTEGAPNKARPTIFYSHEGMPMLVRSVIAALLVAIGVAGTTAAQTGTRAAAEKREHRGPRDPRRWSGGRGRTCRGLRRARGRAGCRRRNRHQLV